MEATQVPLDKRVNKKMVVPIYVMEYYSAIKRNKILPFVRVWVNPDRRYYTK